eukprot:15366578-Ditylum_brightwellii.AAC.1
MLHIVLKIKCYLFLQKCYFTLVKITVSDTGRNGVCFERSRSIKRSMFVHARSLHCIDDRFEQPSA